MVVVVVVITCLSVGGFLSGPFPRSLHVQNVVISRLSLACYISLTSCALLFSTPYSIWLPVPVAGRSKA